jgi:hypothetical protein
VRIGLVPLFEIRRRSSALLFFLDGTFPWLVGLFRIFPICPLAWIVVRLFAHGRLLKSRQSASASLADAFDLLIDFRILRILGPNCVVALHRGA